VALATCSAPARAQEPLGARLSAPSKSFELQLNSAYTQGFGNVLPGVLITDVAGPGVAVAASGGYRVSPWVSVELEAQYQQFGEVNRNSTNGVTPNVGATLHFSPESRGDPWFRLATGWRFIWQSGNPDRLVSPSTNSTNMFHGWEVFAARFGYDLRATSTLSWAPIVGADLQTFAWDNGVTFPRMQWGTFIYAGLQGRFDFATAPAAPQNNVALGVGGPPVE
jgi:hypothetical protein